MKHSGRLGLSIVILLAAIPFAYGQTQVDMATQTKDVDFTRAAATKPAKLGSTVPTTCGIGELFFNVSSPAGQNLFGCTAANTWSQLAGGGSSGGAEISSQLADFSASDTSTTAQTIGAACNGASSCQIRTGAVIFSMAAPATATLSGTVSSGTVFWYLSSSQILTAGYSGPTTITCSAGCALSAGITAFPPDSIPLWQTTFTTNTWDAINFATMDKRAIYSRDVILAGSGVASSSNASTGVQTLSTDPTVVPRYFADSGAPSATCTAGRDFYTDLVNLHLYYCDAANTWKQTDSRTDVQNFVLASDTVSTGASLAAYSSVAAGTNAATGPNSISYAVAGIPLAVNGAVMVTKKASATWSGASGTVDVAIAASNSDGASGGGTWTLNVYAGCAAANGTYSYGFASPIAAAPPTQNNFQTYTAAGINLPSSCAAGTPMQFWVQRGADAGGTTGIHPFLISMEVVIRGN